MATIYGSSGNDITFATTTDPVDVIEGLDGNDTLYGGSDAGTTTLGTQADLLYGGNGNDTLYGFDGSDTLAGDLDGGTSNDRLFGGDSFDLLFGGGGIDSVYGGDGADLVFGDLAGSSITVAGAVDTIVAGAGSDLIFAGLGNDIVYGESEADWIEGGGDSDRLYGGSAGDALQAGDGNDTIDGGDGDDYANGGAGNDLVTTGTGHDWLVGETGLDSLVSGEGDDVAFGGNDGDMIDAASGNDYAKGDAGSDHLEGGPGDDMLEGDAAFSGTGQDTLYGGEGIDAVFGGGGIDGLYGGDGDDILVGGAGNDTLEGGAGNDTLLGESGTDTAIYHVEVTTIASSEDAVTIDAGTEGIDILVGIETILENQPLTIDLFSLNPERGFIIRGDASGDLAGYSVAGAGDVNGDGYDDMIIGAYMGDDGGNRAGEAYIVFGGPDSPGTLDSGGRLVLDLASLGSTQGFIVRGDTASDYAGFAVSAAGDFNGDDIVDLLIGARAADSDGNNAGAAYLVFGSTAGVGSVDIDGRRVIDLTSLSPDQGFVIQGATAESQAGSAVSYADVNGDGLGDLIIGAPFAHGGGGLYAGQAYVVFGTTDTVGTQDGGGRRVLDLASLGSSAGFAIIGDASFDNAGTRVSSAGDINGDGFDDIALGVEYGDDGGNNAGEVYVIFGAASGIGTIDLTSLTSAQGFILQGAATGDATGRSVSALGDVNADGFSDLLIGAPLSDAGATDAGVAYVVFGRADGFGVAVTTAGVVRQVIDLESLAPSQGFVLLGRGGGDRAGYSVASAGDFNGDGLDDLIVSAPRGGDGDSDLGPVPNLDGMPGSRHGEAWIVLSGWTNGDLDSIDDNGRWIVDLETLPPDRGFRIQGERMLGEVGYVVAGVGDIDDDGYDDLLLSAPFIGNGLTYLIGGSPIGDGLPVTIAGDNSSDTIVGGRAESPQYGGEGNDLIFGRVGGGWYGGGGDDEMHGEWGFNTLYGGNDNDTLSGKEGDDRLDGEDGDDTMDGGADFDLLYGGYGDDRGYGGQADDTLYGGGGNDRDYGGTGDDTIDGGEGNDNEYGGTGDDMIDGGEDNDHAYGGADFDTIDGGEGNDRGYGGTGNDTIRGGPGNDAAYGEIGNDLLEFDDDDERANFFGGDGFDTMVVTGSDREVVAVPDSDIELFDLGGEGDYTLVMNEALGGDYQAGAGVPSRQVVGNEGDQVFIVDSGGGTLFSVGTATIDGVVYDRFIFDPDGLGGALPLDDRELWVDQRVDLIFE